MFLIVSSTGLTFGAFNSGPKYLMTNEHFELLEETVGVQTRRAAVIVGRFSTPTIGHYALFDAVKKYIRENPDLKLNIVPIVVVVEGKETSKDKTKNPLNGAERISFMTGSGKANGIKFLKAGSAFDAFEVVRKAGYEPIAVAAGSDRAPNYLSILNKYFKNKDDSPIKHYSIELKRNEIKAQEDDMTELLRYVEKKMPVALVSGSLARHAVAQADLEKFSVLTGLSDKPKLAKLMFDKIAKTREETNGVT